MQVAKRTIRAFACAALILGGTLAGCTVTTDGNPAPVAGSPTEPSFPTSRPSRSAPPATATPPRPSAPPRTAAPGIEALPSENGYAFIETKSGKTRCQISRDEVGCESQFTNAPLVDGLPANGLRVKADGTSEWVLGNLGAIPAVTLDYRSYSAEGWTIAAGEDGTRFTNDATGHGMFIRVQGVDIY